jgi:hypothetical protein
MAPEPTFAKRRAAGLVVAALAAAVGLAACGASSSADHGAGVEAQPLALTGGHATIGQLSITGAYIPAPATPSLGAAYFTVTNAGPADRLMSVTTSAYRSAQLNHYVTDSSGAQSMVAVHAGAVIPAHGRLVLTPGSYHVMLRRPVHVVKQGLQARLTLRFQHAGQISLVVPVVADTGLPGAGDSTSMPGMDMSGHG